jgi:hypothetical protein
MLGQLGERAVRLRLLVGLIALEALAMLVVTVGYAVALVVDKRSSGAGFVVFEIVLAAIAAAALLLVARGLRAGRRWASSLGVTLQLIGLPFGVRLWQFGHWYAAIPELVVVAGALVLLFSLPPEAGDSEQPAQPDAH